MASFPHPHHFTASKLLLCNAKLTPADAKLCTNVRAHCCDHRIYFSHSFYLFENDCKDASDGPCFDLLCDEAAGDVELRPTRDANTTVSEKCMALHVTILIHIVAFTSNGRFYYGNSL